MSYQQRQQDLFKYRVVDYLMAVLAWATFYFHRKIIIEQVAIDHTVFQDINLYLGMIIIPIGWMLLFSIFEGEEGVYRKSRLSTLSQTFFLSFLGALFLFFALILDDTIQGYYSYYQILMALVIMNCQHTSPFSER